LAGRQPTRSGSCCAAIDGDHASLGLFSGTCGQVFKVLLADALWMSRFFDVQSRGNVFLNPGNSISASRMRGCRTGRRAIYGAQLTG